MTDKIVFWGIILGAVFVLGMDYGKERVEAALTSQCVTQPGEKLISSVQTRDGVLCNYANGYGRAIKRRKA